MYGKHFESMYEGSMYGAGVNVFAVWGYVIAKAQKSRVELNPKKLADTLGGTEQQVVEAITFLTSPDPSSRHREHEGRRLVEEGQFQYFVPSWADYRKIRNEDERREYNRIKQAEHREKLRSKRPKNGKPLPGEVPYCAAVAERGPEPVVAGEPWAEPVGVVGVAESEQPKETEA